MQSPSYTFPDTLEHPAQSIYRDQASQCRFCERYDIDPPRRFAHCVHLPCDNCGRCLGCGQRPRYTVDGHMIG